MSILLEALRKTEKSQRPHEAPSIHESDESGPVSEPLQTGPLALLLIVALFVSGWFVWQQYQPPVGGAQATETLSEDQVSAIPKPAAADASETSLAKPPVATADKIARQQRTPMESFQPAVENETPAQADSAKPQAVNVTKTLTSNARPRQSVSNAAPAATPGTISEEKFKPHEPAPIGYWELPDAVRADVPEIKFSVLVYATDPANRFVLINGQRLGEGDSSQPGLVVEEIRLDGVIFSYRLYRFLVEK